MLRIISLNVFPKIYQKGKMCFKIRINVLIIKMMILMMIIIILFKYIFIKWKITYEVKIIGLLKCNEINESA